MSEDVFAFPVRFRGYDREAVDHELHELRTALDYAHAERDRAVARALTLENGEAANPADYQTSTTVQWLIDTAEQDAEQIRDEAQKAAADYIRRAEELLRHRVELIEQAQHEADACRAEAAEEARQVIHDALEKANTLLQGLQESEQALREMFDSGVLARRMPPPRRPVDEGQAAVARHAADAYDYDTDTPRHLPVMPQPVPHQAAQAAPQPVPHAASQSASPATAPQAVPQPAPADQQQS